MSKYPEADKVSEHKQDMQVIGDFLTWFFSNGITPCVWRDFEYYHAKTGEKITREEALDSDDYHVEPRGYYPINKNIEQWLANYFNIDRQKYEEEKMQMLNELREGRDGN